MKITLDFETRSRVDIRKTGMHKYAEDPSTEVMCLAIKAGNEDSILWVHPKFNSGKGWVYSSLACPGIIEHAIENGYTFEAHNAGFEMAIWSNIMVERYGWPEIKNGKWFCSAAKVAAYALPRSLGGACDALDVPIKKDGKGYAVMLRLCKPKKPSKKDPSEWDESPDKLLTLFEYCKTDTDAEHNLSNRLRELVPREREIWLLDQKINQRGFQVDIAAVEKVIEMVKAHEERMLERMFELTGIRSPKQVQVTKEWLSGCGVVLPDLKKDTVTDALKRVSHPAAKEVLQIRQSVGKSSTAKYQAFLNGVSADGRMRGTMLYHGAAPGRWAGMRVQPHNMPREGIKDFEFAIEMIKAQDFGMVDTLFGDPKFVASKLIRNMIIAKNGHTLYCPDYKSVEGRVLAWLAGEEYVLKNYYDGKCAYCNFASQIHEDYTYEEIYQGKKNDIEKFINMRFEGKTGELACGYQGGEKAILEFAATMEKKRRKEIVKIWRHNRPETKQFWNDLGYAAVNAVKMGTIETVGKLKFGTNANFLHIILPSGRPLSYYDPKIESYMMYCYHVIEDDEESFEFSPVSDLKEGERIPDKDFKAEQVTFMGVNSETKRWERKSTYGGKLAENSTQAVARDFLAEALIRVENAGYEVVLHVHDEIIAEVPKGFGSLKEFEKLMCVIPDWGVGCPIDADSWEGPRYKK